MRKIQIKELKRIFDFLTIADKILIILLIILSVLFFLYFYRSKTQKEVIIYYKGKLYGDYPISINRKIVVDKGIEIQIKNGKARVLHSTCKRKYCVKQGWSNSYPIVCVPNKLILKFKGEKKLLITK